MESLERIWGPIRQKFLGRPYRLVTDDPDGHATEKPGDGWLSSSLSASAASLGWTLLPSFVAARWGKSDVQAPVPNSTSYLNGVRGVAATIVVCQHVTTDFYRFVHTGWGTDEENKYFIQLPYIRLIISGRFMVGIFFILSGFVLSYGPLKHSHAGDAPRALAGLPSSIARRPFRLMLPVFPVMVLTCLLIWLQLFYQDGGSGFQPAAESLWAEFREGWHQFITMAWRPFDFDGYLPPFFPQCWTLGMEFRGSMVVFVCCVAFARTSPTPRLLFLSVFAWYALQHTRWEISLFLAGMALADLRHVRAGCEARGVTVPGVARRILTACSWALLALGLFLGGWPIDGENTAWGYEWIHARFTPGDMPMAGQYYWDSVGAMMVLVALENLPVLQRLLNARPLLYLGEISFGVYLAHWLVAFSVGKGTIYGLRGWGASDFWSWFAGAIVAFLGTVWAGDVHWRLVDQQCVTLSKWITTRLGI